MLGLADVPQRLALPAAGGGGLGGDLLPLCRQEWISRALTGNPLALPLAAILGGCLHSDVFSILPIVRTIYAYSPRSR